MYLQGKISLREVRKKIKFDSFGWGWKWDNISRVLKVGHDLGLRVISAERGNTKEDPHMADIAGRNRFSAATIAADAAADQTRSYVILYGSGHILGNENIPALVKASGQGTQAKVINLLGRLTYKASLAAGSEDAKCLSFDKETFFEFPRSIRQAAKEYLAELKEIMNEIAHEPVRSP